MPEKILLDPHFRRRTEIFRPEDLERLYGMADVVWGEDAPAPDAQIVAVRSELVAIVGADWRYGPAEDFPRLRAILEVSGRPPDPDRLDYPACSRRGISVLSCAPAFGPAVAEMALALTLAAARDLVAGDTLMRRGVERWGWAGNAGTFLLYDQPVGFVGFGGLARALKPLLAPFRCPIRAYDPGVTDAHLRTQGVTPSDLDSLLADSRVIYVLAAPTPTNRGLLSRERLARLRPDALLVLVSRAHLIDFDALTEMVCAGRFRAAIDVFPEEPLSAGHPIRQASGAILSAHRAGGDGDGFRDIGRMVVNDLEAILSGLPPREMQLVTPGTVTPRAEGK